MFSRFFPRHEPQTQPLFALRSLQLSEKVHWLASKGLVDPLPYVQRHLRGDWGDVDEACHQANDIALEQEGALRSRYRITRHLELVVITSNDRSSILVQLPEEHQKENTMARNVQDTGSRKQLFSIGALIFSAGVDRLMRDGQLDPLPYIQRHTHGDWGDVTDERWQANNAALQSDDRLDSSYAVTHELSIHVFTEADRSATHIILTSEH